MKSVSLLLLLALTGLSSMVNPAAAAPGLISYQGRLTNPQGQPITSSLNVTFSFFNAPSGGAMIGNFTDTDTVTPNKDGVYSTMIGDDNAPIPPGIFEQEAIYLNVNIGGEDLLPRQRVTSSPYVLNNNHTKNYVAAGAVKAGDVVMAGTDGKIRKAQDPGGGSFTLLNTPTPSIGGNGGAFSRGLARVAADKFVAVYTYNNQASLIICKVNANGSITMATTAFPHGDITQMAGLGSGLLVYNGTNWFAGTVGTSSITWGAPVGNLPDKCLVLDSSRVAFIKNTSYSNWDAGDLKIGTVQNNTLTITASTSIAGKIRGIGLLEANKFACLSCVPVFNPTLSSYDIKVAIATLSGGTITFGDWIKIDSSKYSEEYGDIAQVDTGKALLTYKVRSFHVLTANGTTPVLGAAVPGPYVNYSIQSTYPERVNQAYIRESDSIVQADIAGTNASFTTLGQAFSTAFSLPGLVMADANHFFAWIKVEYPELFWGVTVVPVTDFGQTLEGWIGVAEQTVAAGQSCRVTIAGGITSQFKNLIPGRRYMITQNGLKAVPMPTLRYYHFPLIVGKAIAPDELLVTYDH